jgi:hypothetical protein
MNLNFKNILTESVIDDMNISKLDKSTLKVFNIIKDDKFYYPDQDKAWDMSDGQRIVKASEMLKIGDYDYLYSMYDFYDTYGHVLFQDIPKEIPKKTIPFNSDYEHILGAKLLQYYYDNYNGKIIVSNETGDFVCGVVSEDINEAIMEEMYSVEIRNYRVSTSIFVNMFPNKKEPNKLGSDYLSMSDELSEFIPIYRETDEGDYEEIVDSKYFDIDFPKDMSDGSLKKYFDDIIKSVIKEMIIPNNDLMVDFISANTV